MSKVKEDLVILEENHYHQVSLTNNNNLFNRILNKINKIIINIIRIVVILKNKLIMILLHFMKEAVKSNNFVLPKINNLIYNPKELIVVIILAINLLLYLMLENLKFVPNKIFYKTPHKIFVINKLTKSLKNC